jgi:guanylate kinase
MVQALLERVPELQLAVSATTRPQRPGEANGVHYWFITDDDFDRKLAVPGAVTIFVDAPLDELERRLRERATESAGEIEERIELARGQKELAGRFDYVVENDDRERAASECVELVRKELRNAATMARP